MANKLTWALLLIFLLTIFLNNVNAYKVNDCVQIVTTCSNCTYANITSVQTPNGLINLKSAMTKNDLTFNYSFCNASLVGDYTANGIKNDNNLLTSWQYSFSVSQTGQTFTTPMSILYIGLLIILGLFLALTVQAIFSDFDDKLRLFWLLISYLIVLAIAFIANQLSGFYLYDTFFNNMFYLIWLILMIGFLPLLIFIIALIVINVIKQKEIQELVERGID